MKLREYPTAEPRKITFTVTVEPCKISLFTGQASPSELSYAVGSASMTTFALSFTQEAACGYSESVQILTDLPDFITFNEADNDFTIVTNDIVNAGSHTIQIKASI